MFGGKNTKSNGPARSAALAAPPQERTPAKPAITTPSIIAPGTLIMGGIRTAGDIQIDGRIEGDLFAASATLGSESELVGDLFAERAHIRGHVDGNVYAHHVMLAAGAHVDGDLSCRTFEVESGAKLEGSCRHPENPLAEAQTRQASTAARAVRNQPVTNAFPAPRNTPAPAAPVLTNGAGLATAAS